MLLFGILRDDWHAAVVLENIHFQVVAVMPGASFRHTIGLVTKIIDTDLVITDQLVVSRNGEYAGFISDKTRRQRSICMFRWTYKDHITSDRVEFSVACYHCYAG